MAPHKKLIYLNVESIQKLIHYLSARSLLFLQVSGATGRLGVLVPRLVAWEEGVIERERVKVEPRV